MAIRMVQISAGGHTKKVDCANYMTTALMPNLCSHAEHHTRAIEKYT